MGTMGIMFFMLPLLYYISILDENEDTEMQMINFAAFNRPMAMFLTASFFMGIFLLIGAFVS